MLWKVLIAIVLACFVGTYTGTSSGLFGFTFYELFDTLGQLFLNALTLIVVPLVTSAIISGLGQMGGDNSFGKLGLKTFGFYIFTILVAILVGVLVVNVIKPGQFHHPVEITSITDEKMLTHPATTFESFSQIEVVIQILFKLIPINIFEAAAQGNMLGIIFFSLLFGFALMKVPGQIGETLVYFWRGLFQVMMKITHMIMKVMPLGVFCLVAKVTASQGIQSITDLASFFITSLLGLLIFCLVALPIFLRVMGISPIRHIRAIAPALVTAFSTSSSAATLPITIECVEKRAGVSNRVCSFVVPLGTSMNMAGSALYECVAALFIAQVYGIKMTIGHQILIVLLSLITSMGVAAVPSASLVSIIIILNAMGLPKEGLALIIPIDRLLDMCRTTANVFSDTTCAVLVAKSEGEKILE